MNYIDLFAGASGMSEGFKRSGFNPVAHVEKNSDACNTISTRTAYHYLKAKNKLDIYYKYIAGEVGLKEELYKEIPQHLLDSVINREISDETINDIFTRIKSLLKVQQTEKNNPEIDLIIGGPPCQPFSILGRHQNNIGRDKRNFLFVQYGKFLEEFKPKAFVFENVMGLLSANKGMHFENLKRYFDKKGYQVHHDVLNAADYGVLQSRKRVIIVGWKKEHDLGFPQIAKHERKWIVNDNFTDLPVLCPGETIPRAPYRAETTEYLNLYGLRNGIDFVSQNIARPHNPNDLEIYKIAAAKWNNDNIRIRYKDLPAKLRTHQNIEAFVDRFKVVDGKGISHTIVAHIAKDGHHYIHPDEKQNRSLSVREAARLQSFPDDFYFEGSRTASFTQIGNAVPPLMSYAIAQKMKELLCQIN